MQDYVEKTLSVFRDRHDQTHPVSGEEVVSFLADVNQIPILVRNLLIRCAENGYWPEDKLQTSQECLSLGRSIALSLENDHGIEKKHAFEVANALISAYAPQGESVQLHGGQLGIRLKTGVAGSSIVKTEAGSSELATSISDQSPKSALPKKGLLSIFQKKGTEV